MPRKRNSRNNGTGSNALPVGPVATRRRAGRSRRNRVGGNAPNSNGSDIQRRLNALEQRPRGQQQPRAQQGGSILPDLLGSAGSLAAGFVDMPPEMGQLVGRALGTFLGSGDYTLKSNSLINVGDPSGSMVPTVNKDGMRGIRVKAREYIGDIYSGALSGGATIFTNQSLALNPGNTLLFPWLAPIAAQFEQWEPMGIVLQFKSTSSTFNGASQALGTVIMATDYNPSAPSFVSKVEMENADYSNSCRASEEMYHGIECDPDERADKLLLVRTGAIPSNDDVKFYDLANFQVATVGMSTATVNLGELWISYDICFYKKQIVGGMLGNTVSVSTFWTAAGIDATHHFGTSRVKSGTLAVAYGDTTITFPAHITTGRYLLYYTFAGAASVLPTFTATSGCLLNGAAGGAAWLNNGSGGFALSASSATVASTLIMVQITGPSAVITLSGGTYTTTTSAQGLLLQVPFSNLAVYA